MIRDGESFGSPRAPKRVRLADGSFISVGAGDSRAVDSEKIAKVGKTTTKAVSAGGKATVASTDGSAKKDGTKTAVQSVKNSGTPASTSQSPRMGKGGVIPKTTAQKTEPDFPFETYVEITSQGKPVSRDKVLAGFERLRSTYQFPGQIHMIPGHTILMDRDPGFRMHFGPTQMFQLILEPIL